MALEGAPHEKRDENPYLDMLGANRAQAALMGKWAEKQENAPSGNNLVLAWIESGLAARYREYVERHPEQRINLEDETALSEVLERIERTIH